MSVDKSSQIITVKFFASIKEIIGKKELSIKIDKNATVADLKKILFEAYPSLLSQKFYAIFAVNQKVADDSTILTSKSEVAVFPPVSGG